MKTTKTHDAINRVQSITTADAQQAVLSSHSRWARAILDGIRGLLRRLRDRIRGSDLDL